MLHKILVITLSVTAFSPSDIAKNPFLVIFSKCMCIELKRGSGWDLFYIFFLVVVKNGYYCSLLEVMDRNRSKTSVTRLLHELEIKRVVGSAYFTLISQRTSRFSCTVHGSYMWKLYICQSLYLPTEKSRLPLFETASHQRQLFHFDITDE